MCAVIAHMQPEDAIIVDESLTSGGAYWDLSKVWPCTHALCLPTLNPKYTVTGNITYKLFQPAFLCIHPSKHADYAIIQASKTCQGQIQP